MKIKSILLLLSFISLSSSQGWKFWYPPEKPWSVNLKYIGITYHPSGGEGDYPTALDSAGYVVIQAGLESDFDFKMNNYFGFRTSVSLYKDCSWLWSGFFHIGPRIHVPIKKFSFSIGIGPTIIWRENWFNHVDWYTGDVFYGKKRSDNTIQTAFLWYGGNLEFSYQFNESYSFVYSVIPGWPQVFTNSLGAKVNF